MNDIKDPIIKEMVEAGKMSESQIPFDKSKNEFVKPNKEKEKRTLPITYELKNPIDFMGKKITEVTFKKFTRAETVMHFPIQGQYQMGHFLPVISEMTEEMESLIEELSAKDYFYLVGIASDFLL